MKIALISLNQAWEDKEENRRRVLKQLKCVSEYSPELVIFPEMTLTGFTMNSDLYKEDFDSSVSIRFFSNCAVEFNIYIAFGVIISKQNKATNNLIILSPQGQVICRYEKIHPFSFAGEDAVYLKGDKLSIGKIGEEKVGLSICYDLRFPEMFQALSKQCGIIINIANWPLKRIDHWNTLLKARAIENQVYFIGVNRTGWDGNDLQYAKSSVIYTPNGDLVERKPVNEEIDIYDINMSDVISYRSSFPVKEDRLVDFYKKIL